MAYPKLVEGNRVFTAATGNNASSADHNEIQDQLRTVLSSRDISFLSAGRNHESNTNWNAWKIEVLLDGYWWNRTEAAAILIVPVNLYIGQKITSIHCTVSGVTGSTNGSCQFLHGDPTAGALTSVDLDGVTHCWDTGGISTTVDYSDTNSITVTAGHMYYFAFVSATNAGATYQNRVYKAYVKAQFGN